MDRYLDLNASPDEAALPMHSFTNPGVVAPANSPQLFFPLEDYAGYAQYSQLELDLLWDFQQGYAPAEMRTPWQEYFPREEEVLALPPFEEICRSVVDVDAIEEDVQILSSPTGFPQARNRTRRTRPRTIVVVEDVEVDPAQPGGIVQDAGTGLSLNSHGNIPSNNAIHSKGNPILPENHIPERRIAAANVNPEPEKVVVRKEPTFECPICFNTLVDAISTICGHIFCETCIKASIKAQKKCPTCRKKLTMSKFHKIYLPVSSLHS